MGSWFTRRVGHKMGGTFDELLNAQAKTRAQIKEVLAMSTFDELRELYKKWGDCISNNKLESARLPWGLANGFRHYIGAPDTFRDSEKSTQKYVFALKAICDDKGTIQYNEPKNKTDVLTLGEDGYWSAGIAVVLDRGENTYPKTDFRFFIRFVLRDRQCELHIGDKGAGKFKFNMDNEESVKPVYEYMVGLLKEILNMKPWDMQIPSKAPIGFHSHPDHRNQ